MLVHFRMYSKLDCVICCWYCLDIPINIHVSLNTLNIFYGNMDEKVNHNTSTGNNESEDFTGDEIFSVDNTWNLNEKIWFVITCLSDLWLVAFDKVLETHRAFVLELALSLEFLTEGLLGTSADCSGTVLMTLLLDDWVHHILVAPGECCELVWDHTKLSIISVKNGTTWTI